MLRLAGELGHSSYSRCAGARIVSRLLQEEKRGTCVVSSSSRNVHLNLGLTDFPVYTCVARDLWGGCSFLFAVLVSFIL